MTVPSSDPHRCNQPEQDHEGAVDCTPSRREVPHNSSHLQKEILFFSDSFLTSLAIASYASAMGSIHGQNLLPAKHPELFPRCSSLPRLPEGRVGEMTDSLTAEA